MSKNLILYIKVYTSFILVQLTFNLLYYFILRACGAKVSEVWIGFPVFRLLPSRMIGRILQIIQRKTQIIDTNGTVWRFGLPIINFAANIRSPTGEMQRAPAESNSSCRYEVENFGITYYRQYIDNNEASEAVDPETVRGEYFDKLGFFKTSIIFLFNSISFLIISFLLFFTLTFGFGERVYYFRSKIQTQNIDRFDSVMEISGVRMISYIQAINLIIAKGTIVEANSKKITVLRKSIVPQTIEIPTEELQQVFLNSSKYSEYVNRSRPGPVKSATIALKLMKYDGLYFLVEAAQPKSEHYLFMLSKSFIETLKNPPYQIGIWQMRKGGLPYLLSWHAQQLLIFAILTVLSPIPTLPGSRFVLYLLQRIFGRARVWILEWIVYKSFLVNLLLIFISNIGITRLLLSFVK